MAIPNIVKIDDVEKLAKAEHPQLSAMVLTYDVDGEDALTSARQDALKAILRIAVGAGQSLWLVAGNAYPQPRTAVGSYNRLWKALEKTGIQFQQDSDPEGEVSSEGADGVRYFGYRHLGGDDLPMADSVLRRMQAFLLLGNLEQAQGMVEGGWSTEGVHVPQEAFIRSIEYEAPIAFVRGEFDDTLVDGVIVGPRLLMPKLEEIETHLSAVA